MAMTCACNTVGSCKLPHASVSEFHSERQLQKIAQPLPEDFFEPPQSYRLDWRYPPFPDNGPKFALGERTTIFREF